MEAFFNGGSGYVEVKKNIIAPGVTIQVDALPNKPTNFSGGVGRFNISASLSKKEVKAGEPVTLRVVVGGIGNLKLIKQPIVNFPNDFDKYDAKVTDKTRLTSNGVEGNIHVSEDTKSMLEKNKNNEFDFVFLKKNEFKGSEPMNGYLITRKIHEENDNSFKE